MFCILRVFNVAIFGYKADNGTSPSNSLVMGNLTFSTRCASVNDKHNAMVTLACEIKLSQNWFSLRRRPSEIILGYFSFRRVVTCEMKH